MSKELSSYIAVVSDLEAFQATLLHTHGKGALKLFIKDDFLVEDAKAVIKEAYVAEATVKVIALGAKSYNIYAQNTLLKILEEPPRNTVFVVGVLSKTSLLPTIRSRLPIHSFAQEKTSQATALQFRSLSLKEIYAFVQARKFLERQELKTLLQTIVVEATQQGVHFTHQDLELFGVLVQLAELNSRAHNLLMTQLLTIYQRVRS
ncbi:MAG: DNA polymerase III subunit delta' [Campylobacterales bacterium]|nr:DNA polymerase III subunit delta' [Campylobacterales bacterium]